MLIVLAVVTPLIAHEAAPVGAAVLAGKAIGVKSQVNIKVVGDKRIVEANGIPDHKTGEFPNRNNPHAIEVQKYRYMMPAKPKLAAKPTPMLRQPFGIAINGVLFDPGTAEYWNNNKDSGWRYDALSGKINLGEDDHHAHVQPNGAYHYHGIPTAIVKEESKGRPAMVLIGWAADGFPIYGPWGYVDPKDPSKGVKKMRPGYKLKKGQRPGTVDPTTKRRAREVSPNSPQPGGRFDGTFNEDFEHVKGHGDLDECNGRFGVTPEFPKGIYHYYITEEFPFVPRNFKGTPDKSFEKRGAGARGPGHGGGRGGRGPRGGGRRGGPPPRP